MSKPQYHWGAVLLIAWWVVLVAGFGVVGNLYMTVLALQHGRSGVAIIFAVCAMGGIVYCYRTYCARPELRAIAKR